MKPIEFVNGDLRVNTMEFGGPNDSWKSEGGLLGNLNPKGVLVLTFEETELLEKLLKAYKDGTLNL